MLVDSASVTYYGAFHFVDGADAETEYVYDANGNMTQDFNKKISKIEYNSLNLPSMIQYSHGYQAHYGYDAAGRKLSVRHIISPVNIYVPMGSTTLPENAFLEWRGFDVYADNIQYFMEKSLSVFPTRLNFDGGYITSIDDTPVYHYYLQDHLGNNRMVVNTNGEVEQVNHDYAFGGLMGESTDGDTQTYKYNGKELDCINGLDWYDYGARNYDAALGRWHVVDPLAEKYYNVSPYAYCNNNPIRFIDPDGRQIVGVTKKDAQNFRDDVYKVLADDKYSGVRELITIKGNKFNKIDGDALTKVLDGVTLSIDERTYIDMVTNTINSKDVHKVEYVNISGDVSLEGGNAINDHFKNNNLPSPLTPDGTLKAATLSLLGGEGFNTPTKKGSHSVIISGVSGSNTERAVTSGHEVFGHGIPSARRESDVNNNTNAIRTDNLIRRILGLPQRDGSDHAGGFNGGIVDPQKLPRTQ